jgi:hypothetical protein
MVRAARMTTARELEAGVQLNQKAEEWFSPEIVL